MWKTSRMAGAVAAAFALVFGAELRAEPLAFKPNPAKPVFVELGPRVPTVRYADAVADTVETHTVWKPFCVDPAVQITVEDLRRIAEISKAAAAANPPPEERVNVAGAPPQPFNLVFNPTTPMPSGALPALAEVEYYVESQFTDPITVTINIAFANLGPGVLGGTSSSYANVTWPVGRDALINGMDAQDTLQSFVPPGSTIPVRYNGNADTVTNETRVFVTIANHRATVGTILGTAASMTFNNQFAWDYDPPIFEIGGTFDFQSVIVHEVGHALGFTSGADFRSADIEMLDVYRFQRSDGVGDYNPDDTAEFSTTARMVDQNAPGTADDVNSDLINVEYQMSDGVPNQCSHFHEQSPSIGIMDPTIGSGQTFYPNFFRVPDLNMFDAIGYDYPHLNQTCPDARDMVCNSSVHVDNSTLANLASPNFSCGNGNVHSGALWFRFVATHDSAHLSTCDSQSADPTFAVYENDCGSLVEIGCSEDGGCPSGATRSTLCVTGLTPGNTYYVQVAARNLSSRGIIELDLECSCDGACCLPPPGQCLVADQDFCEGNGGSFSGGNTACAGDVDGDGRDDTCQSEFLAVSQVPTDAQEGMASNLDAGDGAPQVVLAEEFESDGRPIRAVRWWGSALDPGVVPDGWFVGFHEPLILGGSPTEALALYFCGAEAVAIDNMAFDTCDVQAIVQHTARLADCCLVASNLDSRSSATPGTSGGFLAERCTGYAISLQAVAGRRYDPDGLGGCTATATAESAATDFWGWQSTPDDEAPGAALSSTVSESSGDWVFAAWGNAAITCGAAHMTFELITSDPLPPEAVIWGNGLPNGDEALNTQFGGVETDVMTVDDVTFAETITITDLHWLCEEQNTFTWDNKVRLEIYPDGGSGAPDESGGPTLALWVPDDGGAVDRVSLGAGTFFPRYRYDMTGLSIVLPPGTWWIGMATAGTAGSTGRSFWLTSHEFGVDPLFFGSEAYVRAPSDGVPNFVPWSTRVGGELYDVSFDVTSTTTADCNCNGVPDDEDAAMGPDCNSNGVPDECEPDCNANGSPDDCDVTLLSSLDCQPNGRPDECDIAYGDSADSTGDGIPDECCQVIATPMRDPADLDKCRFITLPPAEAGLRAIRVRLTSLHHPNPPYSGDTVQDFSSFEGEYRWVGPPAQYVESTSNPTPFMVSNLQCEPFYNDWSTVGTLHVSGREIVPSSEFDVQWITTGCVEGAQASYSDPLVIPTTRWGDVTAAYHPPDPSDQPDFVDVGALVDKFKSTLDAPIKARALLAGDIPDPTPDFAFTHISACVDAFRGLGFPYSGPAACP